MGLLGNILKILLIFLFFNFAALADVIFVSNTGSDNNTGYSSETPLKFIQSAINKADPGDKIIIMPGRYYEKLTTIKDGTKNNPIKVLGTNDVVIYGDREEGGRIIEIKHSFIEIYNLNIDGHFGFTKNKSDYHDKLIYIIGNPELMLEGLKIVNSDLQNAWGECLRLKFVKDVEIAYNSISSCGLRDYVFGRNKQNGEGIYIGTAPEQTKNGKLDKSRDINIHHNIISTFAAECIDVKEGTEKVTISENICYEQKAPSSGGISVRGNYVTVENNMIFNNSGAGVRLGGDNLEYGRNNCIKNNFIDTSKYGIKIMNNLNRFYKNLITDNNESRYYPKDTKIEERGDECR